MDFFCPRLEIKANINYSDETNITKEIRGEIKDNLDFEKLITSEYIYKNEALVDFLKDKSFNLLTDYYSTTILQNFDIYGGIYEVIKNGISYCISLYFYKIKNPELITKEFIMEYNLIFQQTYLIENNILDMDYHDYRMSLFFKELSNPKFLNLTYETNPFCKTKLFRYQRHNISQLLHFHTNGISVKFNNNLLMYFDNGLIYDLSQVKFIKDTEIQIHNIFGGIVMDEPGTGKTLQFIIYLLEAMLNFNVNEKALILVPDNDIKKHWVLEFAKHIVVPLIELPIIISTFNEFENNLIQIKYVKIIVVDEIHTLWKSNKTILNKLLQCNIKYRWGLSATPFITQDSLFNIISFLVGQTFQNERIANIPRVQNEIMKIFLKNTKLNTKDEHAWPEISFIDQKLTFDKIQQDLYDTEAKTAKGILNLQLIACQMQLMYDITQSTTPKELKEFGNLHYKTLYVNATKEYNEIVDQITNIHKNKHMFSTLEFIERLQHFELLLKHKESEVRTLKGAYDYHTKSINQIESVLNNCDPDDVCAICLSPHEPPITYFKPCGHYFCNGCVNSIFSMVSHTQIIKCPYCRKDIGMSDIVIVKDKCDITASAKCTKLIEIISTSPDRFIIFTQFPKLIENLIIILRKHNLNLIKFSQYKTLEQLDKNSVQCIILSSEENAAGIDLSEFSNVIIFEPFENSLYCREIEKQLIGRIHRINQSKDVNVYRLIMLNTIEEQIYSKFI